MGVFSEAELVLASLIGCLNALNVTLTSSEGEKYGVAVGDAWVRYMCIDTWR